ncbi:hypothetical protein [Branchiibius cervicis]|uniref:LPXTG cell wall anchor domain-containing protein n=1 Tax=Branchiibius cervicis TaxID=908252 RepID=A0ABW2ARU6_9MICO
MAAGQPADSAAGSGNTAVAVGAGVVAVAGLGGAGLLAARRRRG